MEKRQKDALTLLFPDLPSWLQDNHYIRGHYRPPSNSWRKSVTSIAQLHNESVNIWTHLIGAIAAAVVGLVMWRVIQPRFILATHEDTLVFSCFFLGAIACLGMSATYHTISNHSQTVSRIGNMLDHVGIVFMIWGSFVPSIYYGFSREPGLVNLYWGMITSMSALTLSVVLLRRFRTPEWRSFRAKTYVCLGISAVVPVIHGLSKYGFAKLEKQIGLSWLVLQGVLYLAGATIYAARIPERFHPGRFDLFGSSHQIFHLLVLLAATSHFMGLIKAFDHEHGYRGRL
ncbi:HlyIII-domain-containing protein [Piedraia hortae CBS 480.64]|uniref:HlyIII-domain-containing protein n=1 Tax=Piedraia hortae CBS 480.64 TaxID=1314780 RepID=A0A6A7BXE9_9PEZI|nr:HlyIII-domain-containing protein [Piedraia hortae CBS 480.64]